jgi:hypothetical protein
MAWAGDQESSRLARFLSEASAPLRMGEPEVRILRIQVQLRSYEYTWYVVPGDDAQRQWIMQQVRKDKDAIDHIVAATRHSWAAGEKKQFRRPARSAAGSADSSAPALYDASNSDEFAGLYTVTELLVIDGASYLWAVPFMNRYGRPDVALFRFAEGGVLEPLCWEIFSP